MAQLHGEAFNPEIKMTAGVTPKEKVSRQLGRELKEKAPEEKSNVQSTAATTA